MTFSPECADEFPSIQYFAPGNPLLGQVIDVIRRESEQPERLSKHTEGRDETTARSVVCGWGRDGTLATLGADGTIEESMSSLPSWMDQFLTNRDRTNMS